VTAIEILDPTLGTCRLAICGSGRGHDGACAHHAGGTLPLDYAFERTGEPSARLGRLRPAAQRGR
jgi:hypothetical protein